MSSNFSSAILKHQQTLADLQDELVAATANNSRAQELIDDLQGQNRQLQQFVGIFLDEQNELYQQFFEMQDQIKKLQREREIYRLVSVIAGGIIGVFILLWLKGSGIRRFPL